MTLRRRNGAFLAVLALALLAVRGSGRDARAYQASPGVAPAYRHVLVGSGPLPLRAQDVQSAASPVAAARMIPSGAPSERLSGCLALAGLVGLAGVAAGKALRPKSVAMAAVWNVGKVPELKDAAETVPQSPLLRRSLLAARCCSLAFVPPACMDREPYFEGLRCIAQVETPGQSGATVFEATDGRVIIACRGSASVKNFATNLDIGPVPLDPTFGAPPSARVHNGFQKAARELWARLEPTLPPKTEAPILLTGHSLGGGTAALLGLHLAAAGREAELLTVAGPRLGNAAFAAHYRRTCAPAFHLVHDDDDVLQSNTQLWNDLGFEHVGSVVKCDQDVACFYEDEDAECPIDTGPSGPPSLKGTFVDHCNYLGVYIGVRLQHPSVWLRSPF